VGDCRRAQYMVSYAFSSYLDLGLFRWIGETAPVASFYQAEMESKLKHFDSRDLTRMSRRHHPQDALLAVLQIVSPLE